MFPIQPMSGMMKEWISRATLLARSVQSWHHMKPIEITYFSDVLCIWAYASQARIEVPSQLWWGIDSSVISGLFSKPNRPMEITP